MDSSSSSSSDDSDLDEKLETARAVVTVLEAVQAVMEADDSSVSSEDEVPVEPLNVLDLESQSLYEVVLHRFESTLYRCDDGFPAAFDSLSEDVLHLLKNIREFVIKCFQR